MDEIAIVKQHYDDYKDEKNQVGLLGNLNLN